MRRNFDTLALKLQNLDKLPQIIVLTEIWIDDNETDMYKLPGYVSYFKCNLSRRAGGVFIFVAEHYSCSQIDKINLETADCVHLKITLADNTLFEILGIYRFHEFSPNQFSDELDKCLKLIKNKNMIICGDMNINLLNSTNCVNNYLMIMANHGLSCKINEATRIKNNSQSLIDHIFIRSNVNMQTDVKTWIIDSQIVDHFMTAVAIKQNRSPVKSATQSSNVRLDFQRLNKAISNADWRLVYTSCSVSIAFSHFSNILQLCIKSSCVQKKGHKNTHKKLKPWMNEQLLRKVKEKNALYKQCLKEPLNTVLSNQYKHCKNALSNEISIVKINYYKDYFETNKRNPKRQWQCIKEIIGETRSQQNQLSLKNANGVVESDPKIVANIFNGYFSSIANDLRLNINKDRIYIKNDNIQVDFVKEKYITNSIFLYPTTQMEIKTIINSLSTRKAPGYDLISPALIKNIADSIAEHLTYLVNFSLSSGEFPSDLKNAIIIPLHKKSDKLNPSNFRPIALLSIFSKIFEKILKTRLVNFLENEGFFSKNQFGFQKKLNTENALLDFFGKVFEGMNDGDFCAGLFVDVMKAFDTVDHSILLDKMCKAGIRGVANQWFRSYLSGRKQRVRVGDVLSEEVEASYGIPQGSVLSGPLFLIYVNSLCDGKFQGKLTAFADDTSLFYRSSSALELKNIMQNDIKKLRIWFTDNYLVMSPKTQALVFNLCAKNKIDLSLKYHEITCLLQNCGCLDIDIVDNIKYLGLFVDNRLSWKTHVNYVKNKILKYTRIFYLIRPFCDAELLRKLYFAFINSKIDYALTLWGGTYNSTLKTIITQQKKFVRVINNSRKTDHTSPIFRKLNILPLKNLYIYKVLKVYFNMSNKQRSDIRNITLSLRSRLNAYVPRPKLTMYKKFFTYLAPKFYNCLPYNVKCIQKEITFLKKLKNHLLFHENLSVFYDCLV